jgi:hypothetical protein|tara:strand:- start:5710 stop:5994 length:285 start_codon:yes stop_codon:yes gene_type:complete
MTSPYKDTEFKIDGTLDLLSIRPIPAFVDDKLYTIEPQYNHRPDLLAYDYYGNKDLWWIFGQRNMDIIEDFIYDISTGTSIYLPNPSKVKDVLE